jgi:hypothetical protein
LDFGLTTAPAVESGFLAFNVANPGGAELTQAVGTFTVRAYDLDAVGGRDRANPLDAGAFTYGDLMRDLLTRFQSGRGGTAAAPIVPTAPALTIDGLVPNTSYSVQLWSLDYPNNNGSVSTWYDLSSGSATQFGSQITNVANTVPTTNTDFSTTGIITTDATGRFSLGASFTLGSGQLNGLIISTTVPEPTGVVGVGMAGLMVGRRRKR